MVNNINVSIIYDECPQDVPISDDKLHELVDFIFRAVSSEYTCKEVALACEALSKLLQTHLDTKIKSVITYCGEISNELH